MAGLAQFAGWLATQVFDVVGSVAGVQGSDADDAGIDLQVGRTVFHDVPAKMRTELWMSQLQRKGSKGAATMGEYRDLLFEKLSEDVLAEIDKDTHRTFPGHKRLSMPAGQEAMLHVLRAYALSDPEIGYTQGMNFLAGLLLTYLPSEAEAYCALALLMRQRGLREMYLPDMSVLQIRLWQLGKLLPPTLAAHLEAHAVLPVLYASSWLLTCFAADFPFHFAARVMDVLMTGHHVASPVLKIAVAIVTRCQADLMRMTDFEEMVHHLRQDVPRWPRAALQDLLTDALSKPWTARQLKVLAEINGAETVIEAVARVNNLVQQPTCEAAEVAAMLEQAGSSAVDAPQQRPAQPSPRTVARSLSNSFRGAVPPLPPPPRSGADAVPWGDWQAPDHLQDVATQQVRIDQSIGDLVDLDPHLSQALSAYPHAEPSFAPFGAAGAGGDDGAEAPQQQLSPAASAADGGAAAQLAASPAEAKQKWDAFASETSTALQAAPSPFESPAPPPKPPLPAASPLRAAVTFDTSQLQALRQEAAAPPPVAAPGARAASMGSPQVDEHLRCSPSFGSYQLGSQPSALPLVLGAPPAGGSAPAQPASPPRGFFNRAFGRGGSTSPDRGSTKTASEAASSGLIEEVPSSHGSSLAAVLSQLGLGSHGAAPPAAAQRHGSGAAQLRHGSDEGWGSFKTAQGSQGSGGVQSHALNSLPVSTDTSWHSTVASARRNSGSPDRLAQLGGRQDSRALSSTASSTLPAAGAAGVTPHRLNSAAANQRAVSLQEEAIQGFLSSSKEQAQQAQQGAGAAQQHQRATR